MTDEATLAANRHIGRLVLLELWGAGKLDVADELYAPDYVDHVGRGPEASRVVGPAGIKQAVMLFRGAFPDLQYFVEEVMAARDLVWTRFSARGTHLGPFLGAPPTGKTVTYTGMDLNRIAGGKIVESWVTTMRWRCSSRSAWCHPSKACERGLPPVEPACEAVPEASPKGSGKSSCQVPRNC